MGILIGNREVLTCAHVIDVALGSSWHTRSTRAQVGVCFPFTENECVTGIVDYARYIPPGRSDGQDASDIAVVELIENAPIMTGVATLAEPIAGVDVKVYGFRGERLPNGAWQSHPDGEWVEGRIIGPQPGGRAQFDCLRTTGARVERGFSGGGVYDPNQNAVVGMIVELDRDVNRRVAQFVNIRSALQAIDRSRLKAIVPSLEQGSTGSVTRRTSLPPTLSIDQGGLFVGRTPLEDSFLRYVTSSERLTAMHLVGHGGIGKTALLKRFHTLARDRDLGTVYVDLGFVRSPLDLLRRMAFGIIPNADGPRHYFDQGDRYSRIESELLRRPGLDKHVVLYLSKLPELMAASDRDLTAISGDSPLSYKTFQPRDSVPVCEALSYEDREFFFDPLPIMTWAFAEDVGALERKVVIELDRTERVPAHIGQWLWRDLLPLLSNIVIITAGRDDITQSWTLQHGDVGVQDLGPLSEIETEQYLNHVGLTDHELRRKIARSSGGIPLALELATEVASRSALNAVGDVVDSYLVDRMIRVFLEQIPPDQCRILQRLAIFRRFNRETIAHIGVNNERSIEDMLAIRFMKHVQYGYAVHDSVRDFILRDLRRHEPKLYHSLHAEAANYYASSIGSYVEGHPNFLEWLYHKLSADHVNGFEELRSYFTAASLAVKPDFCEAVIGVARESDVENNLPQLWLRFFEGSISRQRFDFSQADRVYSEILRDPEIEHDRELKAELLYQRCVALWYLCRFEDAIRFARESMALNDLLGKSHFYNRSLGVVGLSLDRMGDFGGALRAVRQMAQRGAKGDPVSQAYALNSIGYFSWHAGNWRTAETSLLACLDKWVDLKNPIGECYPIGHLGLLYAAIKQDGLALEYLTRAQQLCEHCGNLEMLSKTLQNMSAYHRLRGHAPESRAFAEQALAVSKRLKHPYYLADSSRLLAEACLAMGDNLDARQAVDSGLENLSGTRTLYLQARLEVLRAVVDVYSMLSTSSGDPTPLVRRLMLLGKRFDEAGFQNVAAHADFTALRITIALAAADGATEHFERGITRAFRYNWYAGMDFLEKSRGLLLEFAVTDGTVLKISVSRFKSAKLRELYAARESHTLKSFVHSDEARISAIEH